MTRRPGRRPSVVLTGPVPPPVSGAAVVTGRMLDLLATTPARVVVVDSNANASAARRVLRLLTGLARLALLVAARRRPALYVGGAGGEMLWVQAVFVAIARIGGGPMVFHHHNMAPLHRRSPAMAAVVAAGGGRLLHVVLGAAMERGLAEHYPRATHRRVCSNAGHVPRSTIARPAERGGRVVLGHVSNLSVAKGLPDVLAALRRALDEGDDVELRLGGAAADDEAQAVIDDAVADLRATGHADRLHLAGRLDAAGVERLLDGVDVFCFPSRYAMEAEPLVVLEAARAGALTVAVDRGCVADLVDAPGRVVDEHDDVVAAVVEAVREQAGRDAAARAEVAAGVRAGFERRRELAAGIWEDLVPVLLGDDDSASGR